jgi:hypothetical protein
MSQGDYIKRKHVAQTLRADGLHTPNRFSAIFSSQDLLDYQQYQIVNNDSNTKINYNLITPTGKKIIFDIERNVANCPTFVVCNNTNTRPNRVLRTVADCPFSNQQLTWKETKNTIDDKTLCICQLKRKHIRRNVCSCGVQEQP